jgi:hypothetical protein
MRSRDGSHSRKPPPLINPGYRRRWSLAKLSKRRRDMWPVLALAVLLAVPILIDALTFWKLMTSSHRDEPYA